MKKLLKNTLIYSYLVLTSVLLSCTKDEVVWIPPQVIAVVPNQGIAFDTVSIELLDANLVLNNVSVKFNDQYIPIIMELSDDKKLVFSVPILEKDETNINIDITPNTYSPEINIAEAFTYLPIQIDSLSSNKVYQKFDTIFIYGKNFPQQAESYGIYGRLISDDPNNFIGIFDGYQRLHNVIKTEPNKLTAVFFQERFDNSSDEIYLALGNNYQYVEKTDSTANFTILGDMQVSDYFKLDFSEVTPDERFWISNNNFSDKIFLGDVEATWIFSTPESSENFSRRSGYLVPALTPGTYEIRGFTENDVEMKNLGNNTLSISDITFCPTPNSLSPGDTLRVNVLKGFIYKYACYNCPIKPSLLDEMSGMKFELDFDPIKNIIYGDTNTYFEIKVPSDVPPNNLYSLHFETQNGYEYVPSPECSNPKIFINP